MHKQHRQTHQGHISLRRPTSFTAFVIGLLSFTLLCIITAESAPVPNLIPRRNSIISSILDNRGGRGNNGGISINVGSGSLLHLHRPIVPREDSIKDQVVEHDSERQGQDEVTQSQDDGLNERNIPSTANTNNMGQTHHVYKTFPYNPSTSQGPQLEKRGDTKGYITKGTGSGGMFNKNDPYVRKK